MIKIIFLVFFAFGFFKANADETFEQQNHTSSSANTFVVGEITTPSNSVPVTVNEDCWTGNSPFVVGQVVKSPNSDLAITFSYKEGLKENFTLKLKACIRELIRPDSPIQQGVPFVVEYYKSAEDKKADKKTRVETITDHNGCIQWRETYKYKYRVKPLWIGLERSIKKERTPFAGVETIPMAVNPWLSEKDKSEGVHSILDTRCEYSRESYTRRLL